MSLTSTSSGAMEPTLFVLDVLFLSLLTVCSPRRASLDLDKLRGVRPGGEEGCGVVVRGHGARVSLCRCRWNVQAIVTPPMHITHMHTCMVDPDPCQTGFKT
jgi:hypothetical protein